MKIFKLLAFVLTLSMAFVSCSEDDDSTLVSGNKYETTYAKMETKIAGVIFEEGTMELKSKEELMEEDMYSVIEFKADGKFIADDEEVGTWSQSGNTVTVIDEEDTISVAVNGNKLTVKEIYEEDLGGVPVSSEIVFEFTKM